MPHLDDPGQRAALAAAAVALARRAETQDDPEDAAHLAAAAHSIAAALTLLTAPRPGRPGRDPAGGTAFAQALKQSNTGSVA